MIGGVVLCIGDSLTHGARDPHGLHYPELLARKLSEKHKQCWVGVEKGVNGEKSADVLRRFYDIVRSYPEASEVCLWVGANDAKMPGVPRDVYRKNLEAMVRACRLKGKPLFIGLVPKQNGFGAPDYTDNSLVDGFNAEILDLVDRENNALIWYVDLRPLGDDPNAQCDGIHLTHEANHWVAEQFATVIERARSGNWRPEPRPVTKPNGVQPRA